MISFGIIRKITLYPIFNLNYAEVSHILSRQAFGDEASGHSVNHLLAMERQLDDTYDDIREMDNMIDVLASNLNANVEYFGRLN